MRITTVNVRVYVGLQSNSKHALTGAFRDLQRAKKYFKNKE